MLKALEAAPPTPQALTLLARTLPATLAPRYVCGHGDVDGCMGWVFRCTYVHAHVCACTCREGSWMTTVSDARFYTPYQACTHIDMEHEMATEV